MTEEMKAAESRRPIPVAKRVINKGKPGRPRLDRAASGNGGTPQSAQTTGEEGFASQEGSTEVTKAIGDGGQEDSTRAPWELDPSTIQTFDFSKRQFGPLHGLPQTIVIRDILYDTMWARCMELGRWDAKNLQQKANEGWHYLPPEYAPPELLMLVRQPEQLRNRIVMSRDMVAMIRDRRLSLREAIADEHERASIEALRQADAANIPRDENGFPIGGGAPTQVDLRTATRGRHAVVDLEKMLRELEATANDQLSSGPPPPDA